MGKIRYIRWTVLTVLCGLLTYIAIQDIKFDSVCRVCDNRYLLCQTSESYYKLISDNQVETNLQGLSNCVINLLDDGYEVYRYDVNDTYADIIIQSSELQSVYRYYYTWADHKLTCFCNVYENSWKGLTYILEKEE